MKAALLSGLLIPGAGQVAMKRYGRAAVFLLATLACMGVLIWKVLQQASAASESLLSSGDDIDLSAISDAASSATKAIGGPVTTAAFGLIALLWIAAVTDAYCLGRAKDLHEASLGLPPTNLES